MAWARLDDQFAFNPKIVNAGNHVAGLFARSLCYATAHSTDGFIPESIVLLLADPGAGATRAKRGRDAAQARMKLALQLAEECETAGLWTRCEPGETFVVTGRKDSGRRPLADVTVTIEADGYYIRDFLHYNRARTDARAGESADARANVQRVRAHKDARAARPVPSLPIKEPSLPSNESSAEPPEGQEGINIGNILKEVDAA